MGDMSLPGAHLKDLLVTLECKQDEHFRESSKHSTMAQTYQECAHRLRRALEAEAEKACDDRG